MKTPLNLLTALAMVSAVNLQSTTAQAPQAPKPGPEHARLGYFVGKWNAEGAEAGSDGSWWKVYLVRHL